MNERYEDSRDIEEQPTEPDPRVAALERVVGLEKAHERAARDAKERADRARKVQTELMNARNELHKLLGVTEPQRGVAVEITR